MILVTNPSSSFFGEMSSSDGHWFHGGSSGYDSDWSGSDWHPSYDKTPEFYFDDGGYSVCSTCSQYWYDDNDDGNDTDTEDEMDEAMMSPEEVASYYGSFEGCTEQSLRHEYMFAKRRFRRFTNKRSRFSRFPRRPGSWDLRFGKGGKGGKGRKGKGKGKGYYAGFPFGPSSLAGGKGKKGKGRGNPIGGDGEQMKCHGCGSTDHLVGACDKKGKGKGGFHFAEGGNKPSGEIHQSGPLAGLAMQGHFFVDEDVAPMPDYTRPRAALVLEEVVEYPSGFIDDMCESYEDADDYDNDYGITEADGLQFWHELVAPGATPMLNDRSYMLSHDDSTMQDLRGRFGAIDLGLDAVQNLSVGSIDLGLDASEEVSREEAHALRDDSELWSPPLFPDESVEFFEMNTPVRNSATLSGPLISTSPTTTTTTMTTDDYSAHAAAIGASLFLPWWEEKSADEHFLVRTHMKKRAGEGLLVDPGSPDNLVGSGWSKRLQALMTAAGGPPAKYEPHFLEVGGVGQGAMQAHSKVTHNIVCPTIGGPPVAATFTAPEIESEKVPALLGLKTLTAMNAIMDMGTNRLIVPGPGGVKMVTSPGTVVYPLEPTHSGHLLLPCSEFGRRPREETMTLLSGVNATATVAAETQTATAPQPNLAAPAHVPAPSA